MKLYEICYPDESDNMVVEVLTESEILQQYWHYWVTKMQETHPNEPVTIERCIEDWCTIHWAIEITIPV